MQSNESFLVQLAAAIVKCRRLFLLTFVLLLVVGVGAQLLVSPKYQYVTLLKLAQNGDGVLLEPTQGVLTAIDSQWLAEVRRDFMSEWSSAPGFDLSSTGAGAGFVILTSVGQREQSERIDWLHSAVASKVLESQQVLERKATEKLEAQIEIAEQALAALEARRNTEYSGAGIFEVLISLKGRLVGMESAEARVIAQRKDEELGLGLGFRIGLMLLQAFIGAVVIVMVYYFLLRVRSLMRNEPGRS